MSARARFGGARYDLRCGGDQAGERDGLDVDTACRGRSCTDFRWRQKNAAGEQDRHG